MTTKHTGGHAFPTQSWDYAMDVARAALDHARHAEGGGE